MNLYYSIDFTLKFVLIPGSMSAKSETIFKYHDNTWYMYSYHSARWLNLNGSWDTILQKYKKRKKLKRLTKKELFLKLL